MKYRHINNEQCQCKSQCNVKIIYQENGSFATDDTFDSFVPRNEYRAIRWEESLTLIFKMGVLSAISLFNRKQHRPIQKRRIICEIIRNHDIILERPFHIVVYEMKLRYDSGFAKSSNYVYGWCVQTELVHTDLRIAN